MTKFSDAVTVVVLLMSVVTVQISTRASADNPRMRAPGRYPTCATPTVAALEDKLRRGMYEFIRAERRPVTREQAAAAVGISRKLAAFHLDKLVQAGVLRAGYGLLDDRRRVGRSPKVYEPADIDTRVSIPERRPDFIAGILVDAVLTETTADNGQQAAIRVAGERGPSTAEAERAARRPGRLGAERALTVAETVLKPFVNLRTAYGCETARFTLSLPSRRTWCAGWTTPTLPRSSTRCGLLIHALEIRLPSR
jgi:hypothetical protein